MFLQVDFSKEPFRLLYNTVYTSIRDFALSSGDNEEIVKFKFAGLVAGDERVKLYIDLDDTAQVKAFCLATVQGSLVQADYLKATSGHNEPFVRFIIEALSQLPHVTRIIMGCDENKYKAYKKKYNFVPFKMIMHLDVKRE